MLISLGAKIRCNVGAPNLLSNNYSPTMIIINNTYQCDISQGQGLKGTWKFLLN